MASAKAGGPSLSMPTLNDIASSSTTAASDMYVKNSPLDGTPSITDIIPSSSSSHSPSEFVVPFTPPVVAENLNVTVSVAPPTSTHRYT